jgi:putative transcriptional regulator
MAKTDEQQQTRDDAVVFFATMLEELVHIAEQAGLTGPAYFLELAGVEARGLHRAKSAGKAGQRPLRAAWEKRAIARGEAKPAHVPAPPDVDVKALRRKLDLSQEAFASEFSFSIAQIRDWEQGRSHPLDSNRAYLLLIDRRPEVVRKLLEEMRAEAA